MKPIVTTWVGEPWPILVAFDAAAGVYTWRGIVGDQVEAMVFVKAVEDRRMTPWPVAWKTQPWMKRLG